MEDTPAAADDDKVKEGVPETVLEEERKERKINPWIMRPTFMAIGLALGAGGGYWYLGYTDSGKALLGETSQAVPDCSKYTTEKTALEQRLTQKTQDYDTCTATKDRFKQLAETASQVSDSRYLAIRAATKKGGSEGINELVNLVENYLIGFESEVEIKAEGSCGTGLSHLYDIITSVKDDKVKHDFVVMLTEAGSCGVFSSDSEYLTLKIEK